jgi:hypothetical protein
VLAAHPDRRTWRATASGLALTATNLSSGSWAATVEGPGISERSGEFGTRVAAQRWAAHRGGMPGE